MLIRFVVENFLSFKDRTEFYMSAGSTARHKSHIIEEHGQRVLKGSFLFGANAGGKSNFLRAVQIAHGIVVSENGVKDFNTDIMYFRVNSAYKMKPGVFQFDLMTNGHLYSYGFAVSYATTTIEEEWLYQHDDNKEVCIFERKRIADGQEFDIQTDYTFQDKARFGFLQELFKGRNPKKKQLLFLSDVVSNSPEDNADYQPFRDVMDWFSRITVIYPDSKFSNIFDLIDDDDDKTFLSTMLAFFDTGIEDVSKRETKLILPGSTVKVPQEIMGELEKGFQNPYMKAAHVEYGDDRIEVVRKQDALFASEIMMNHGNPEDLFDFSDESDGTRRLFDLIPIYRAAMQLERVFFVDELDRSLHTKAAQEFIRLFYELTAGKSSQLIATTHDSNLLDLDLLRNDEIWFVDRQKDHSSRLYSLSEFKSRFDRDVEREYLMGRYGALPVFRQSALADMEDRENADDSREGGGDSE